MKDKSIVVFGAGVGVAEAIRILNSDDSVNVCGVVPRLNRKTGVPEGSQPLIEIATELELNLIYEQDINSANFLEKLESLKPALLANWGHGQVFKKDLLNLPKIGVVNLHPGLLPYGRGSGAVVGEIWNCATEIGQVVHFMDEHIDKGSIIACRRFQITGYEYQDEINTRVAVGASEFFVDAIKKALSGEKVNKVSDFGRYYPKPIPGDEIIDWHQSTDFLIRRIRSRSPLFLSRTFKKPERQELFVKRVSDGDIPKYFSPVGQVIDRSERGVLVKTGDTALWVEEISLDGINFFTPSFPIGTSFLSNWMREFLELAESLKRMENELSELKGNSIASEEVELDPLFHCPKCGERHKSRIKFSAASDTCVCNSCNNHFFR
jgi:methionyl-tRNA formyltransferase